MFTLLQKGTVCRSCARIPARQSWPTVSRRSAGSCSRARVKAPASMIADAFTNGIGDDRRIASMALPSGDVFFLDNFAVRQWDDPFYAGTRITFDKEEFVKKVHEYHKDGAALVDGYAPFCKHVFVPNFIGAKVGNVQITPEIQPRIRTAYESRRPEELAVLSRWIPATDVELPEAKMLDIILYSREQVSKEHEALPAEDKGNELPDAPWGIISIKAQDEDHETPMQPITMMRNALGKDEGGSGVPLDKQKYQASVDYWRFRVPVLERD